MEYSKLTKDEVCDIFDLVNSTHLKLTGTRRKTTKQNAHKVWKRDSVIFLMLMKLYESEDLYDAMEAHLHAIEEPFTESKVTFKRYIRNIRFRDEEVHRLEDEMEALQEGKGYISKEQHAHEMDEEKGRWRAQLNEAKDQVRKVEHEVEFLRAKYNAADRRATEFQSYLHSHQIRCCQCGAEVNANK